MNEISRPGVNFGGAGLGTKIEFVDEELLYIGAIMGRVKLRTSPMVDGLDDAA